MDIDCAVFAVSDSIIPLVGGYIRSSDAPLFNILIIVPTEQDGSIAPVPEATVVKTVVSVVMSVAVDCVVSEAVAPSVIDLALSPRVTDRQSDG